MRARAKKCSTSSGKSSGLSRNGGSRISVDYFQQGWFLWALVLLSYVAGHPIYQLALLVPKLDWWLSDRRTMTDRAKDAEPFHPRLVEMLKSYLSIDGLTDSEVTEFSRRIICDKMPVSKLTLEKNLAVVFFYRSMLASLVLSLLLLVSTLCAQFSLLVLALCLLIPGCIYTFYRRHRYKYPRFFDTVWRTAYVCLVEATRASEGHV